MEAVRARLESGIDNTTDSIPIPVSESTVLNGTPPIPNPIPKSSFTTTPDKDLNLMVSFIRGLLRFDPYERLTAH